MYFKHICLATRIPMWLKLITLCLSIFLFALPCAWLSIWRDQFFAERVTPLSQLPIYVSDRHATSNTHDMDISRYGQKAWSFLRRHNARPTTTSANGKPYLKTIPSKKHEDVFRVCHALVFRFVRLTQEIHLFTKWSLWNTMKHMCLWIEKVPTGLITFY